MATSITGGSSANTSTGLGQGIDVSQFVQLALAGDQANITARQNSQSALNAQAQALSQITSDLSNLASAAFTLKDPLGALNGLTATSSDNTVLSATAASLAISGVHTITVSNLATTSSYYSDAVASSSAQFASGSFQISAGGTQVASLTVGSNTNTLDQIAAAINNQTSAVRASIINDANGSRLAIVSTVSGAPGDLSVTGNLTANDTNHTVVNFNQAVQGKNASLVVDGVPISSTTNTVAGVINGVTLNLTSANPNSSVTLAVNPDASKATDAINQFVSAYNTAIKDINAQFAVNSDGTGGGPLEADGSLREAQAALLGAVAFAGSGNNGVVNLASIGVNLNNDGTLSVDNSALASSLSSNFSAVQNFLQSTSGSFAGNLSTTLSNLTDPTAGTLGIDAKGIAQSSRDLAQQISDLQASLAVKQRQLTLVYAKVNTTLQELPLLQAQLSQQLASA
jgi:flagellar hook-associated protein 2